MHVSRNAVRMVLAATFCFALASCTPHGAKFQSSDVTGSAFGRDFALRDPTGKERTLADFRGKAVVVFFGYTQCPDVCPTTLAALAEAMKKLGPDADRVQVVFITVDPERDTPEVLKSYVESFDAPIMALTGSTEAVAQAAIPHHADRRIETGGRVLVDIAAADANVAGM